MDSYLKQLTQEKDFNRVIGSLLDMAPDHFKSNYIFDEKDSFMVMFLYDSRDFALEIMGASSRCLYVRIGTGVFGQARASEISVVVEVKADNTIRMQLANIPLSYGSGGTAKTLLQRAYDNIAAAKEKGNIFSIDAFGEIEADDTSVIFE